VIPRTRPLHTSFSSVIFSPNSHGVACPPEKGPGPVENMRAYGVSLRLEETRQFVHLPKQRLSLGGPTYCRSADQGTTPQYACSPLCTVAEINRLGAEDWRTALGTITRSKRSEGTRDAALVQIAQHITPFSDKTTWELEHCEICCPSFRSPVCVCSPPATSPRKP
jgi:hypothetical protein